MNENDVNLAGLDLNLITALNALLVCGSVTEAALSIGRTQSAMSHSLARLREHFHDPLLVRNGWGMDPTPCADALRPKVAHAVAAIGTLFDHPTVFDPAESTRQIKIAAPDLCAPLLSPFIAKVAATAPHMSVTILDAQSARDAVLRSEADVGFSFGSPKRDPNLEIYPLAPMEWCTFAPSDHPYASSPFADLWVTSSHIVVGQKETMTGPVEVAAQAHGLDRHILCRAPNFSVALSQSLACNALFTTLRAPFLDTAKSLGLVPCPLPFPMAKAPAALILRSAYGDSFQIWLHRRALSILRPDAPC